jgi:outer membrane protein
MTHFRKVAIAAAVASASISGAAFAQAVPAAKIAVVDTQRIYAECNACRTAQTQIQSQLTALQQRAQTLGQPLETEARAIQTAEQARGNRPRDAAMTTRIETFQRNQQAANTEISNGERNIQSIRAHVLQQVNAQLRPIIQSAMTASGANLVVDKGSLLFNADNVDITTTVLGQLNQRLPSVSVTPLPQPAAPAAAPAQPSR